MTMGDRIRPSHGQASPDPESDTGADPNSSHPAPTDPQHPAGTADGLLEPHIEQAALTDAPGS